MHSGRSFFLMGSLAEAIVAVLGLALCVWLVPLSLEGWRCGWRDLLLGLAVTLPMLAIFLVTYNSRWRPLAEIRGFLEEHLEPLLREMSVAQVGWLCLLAGAGEELLFRGALQGGLSPLVGAWPALVLASLVFGLFHAVTWGYICLAAGIGAYLGLVWWWSGNLLVPMLAHAVYDFVAILYLRGRSKPSPGVSGSGGSDRSDGSD